MKIIIGKRKVFSKYHQLVEKCYGQQFSTSYVKQLTDFNQMGSVKVINAILNIPFLDHHCNTVITAILFKMARIVNIFQIWYFIIFGNKTIIYLKY